MTAMTKDTIEGRAKRLVCDYLIKANQLMQFKNEYAHTLNMFLKISNKYKER